MLARVLPIETQAEILKKLYNRKKEILNSKDGNLMELTGYHKVLIENSINKWKTVLAKPTLPGKWTITALLPHFTKWFHRGNNMCLTYRMTQLLTGHGCFYRFLCMIGKVTTPHCRLCGNMEDNAQHTIEHCSAWDEERRRLKNRLGEDLSISNIICRILEENENWISFQSFAEEIMKKKESKEREEEVRANRR